MNIHVSLAIQIGDLTVKHATGVTITQVHDGHHYFEVRVPLQVIEENEDQYSLDKSKKAIGKQITININHQKDNSNINSFKGVITDISLSRYGGSTKDVIFKGYSPTILLEDGVYCRSFSEKKISQIFNEVVKNIPSNFFDKSCDLSPDTKIPYLVQYKETNFDFLKRIAANYGQWMYYNGSKFIFGKRQPAGKPIALTLGSNLHEFDYDIRLVPVNFAAIAHDYIKNENYRVESSSTNVSGLNETANKMMDESKKFFSQSPYFISREVVASESELKDLVLAQRSLSASQLLIVTGSSEHPGLNVGNEVKIDSAEIPSKKGGKNSEDYGTFTLTKVTHYIDNVGNYQNRFVAIPASNKVPIFENAPKYPVCENQVAVVKHNNDPDGLGRIRVVFPWAANDNELTPWIRLVNHHAGKQRGFQFIPEVKDEVLIGFENGNPSKPFVFGSYYHTDNVHDDRQDKKNLLKTIRTISGNEIRIYDKEGEEEIQIQNKDAQNELVLTLKNNGQILIKSKNHIALKAKKITMDAEDFIEMNAQEIKLGAKKLISQKSEKDFEVKAMDVSVTANKDLKMKATSKASLEAQAEVTVKGTAKATLSGAMVEVKGDATAALKGGVVMIN